MAELNDGWIDGRQRLRKCIKTALRKKALTYDELLCVCKQVTSIQEISQDSQEFGQAIFILERMQEIGKNDDGLYYVPGVTLMPKPKKYIRSLDDDWMT